MNHSTACLLVSALTLIADSAQVRADLAEATDFGGTWTTGTEYTHHVPDLWSGQSTTSLDGVDAAEGQLNQATGAVPLAWMETTVTGPTTLYFSYRVTGLNIQPWGAGSFSVSVEGQPEENFFLVGGANTSAWGTDWTDHALAIAAGEHKVRWRIGHSTGRGGPRAYVDQVWTSDDPRPRITETKRTGQLSTPFSWKVPVSSSTPVTLSATGLPRGFAIDGTTHVISGMPTEAGTFEARLTARNASGQHIARVVFEIPPGTTSIPEALDASGLVFTQTAPGTGWSGVTGLGYDSIDTALGLGGRHWWAFGGADNRLSTTIDGPGTLTFWYRCESSGGVGTVDYSFLDLYLGEPTLTLPPSPSHSFKGTDWTKATVPIPAGTQSIAWRAVWNCDPLGGCHVPRYVSLDRVAFVPPDAPQMEVELLPSHTQIPVGGSQSFGEVLETSSASLNFTLKNTGLTPLTGLATSIDGPNAPDFSVTTSPVGPVAGPNGSTSFTVQFSPGSAGPKSATLHIASNDPDDSSFDINLRGTGLALPKTLVNQGASASFSIEAAADTFIQWIKDGVDITGATAASFTIPSAQPWHIGVYSVRVGAGASASLRHVALLELTDVPSNLWRGLVACYSFNESPEDMCRPGKPVSLVSTSELAVDPQRGGVARVMGKGWGVPSLPGEPVELQGPGGYLQIPRPPVVDGAPFTVAFVIKEEGFSLRHGESLFTMGEGAASTDLLAHYWVGGLDGFQEIYAGPTEAVWNHNSDVVVNGSAVSLNEPWTAFSLAADGNVLRLSRNGQLMGSTSYKKDTSGDFFIGRHWWENGASYSSRLIAKVDDVRIYNRALAAPEVQQLFTQVQTTPAAGSFESWALIHGLNGTDAGPSADPERDGRNNWDEFCLGTSPADGREPLMKAVLTSASLSLTWFERDGVVYTLQENPDLSVPWATSAQTPTLSLDQTNVPAGYRRMQVLITLPEPASMSRLFRVQATKAP